MTETKRDYLALIQLNSLGCGSWTRGPNKLDVINRCVKLAYLDWKTTFKLAGHDIMVNVYDVTGHDRVVWGGDGVRGDNGNKAEDAKFTQIERLDLIETVFPGKKAKEKVKA
jgi:hypothetical protein